MKKHEHQWSDWITGRSRWRSLANFREVVQIRFCSVKNCRSAQEKKLGKVLPEVVADRRRIAKSFRRMWDDSLDCDHSWSLKVVRMILGNKGS
jgi:hypothetical protein